MSTYNTAARHQAGRVVLFDAHHRYTRHGELCRRCGDHRCSDGKAATARLEAWETFKNRRAEVNWLSTSAALSPSRYSIRATKTIWTGSP
jgi:hypothetical protein